MTGSRASNSRAPRLRARPGRNPNAKVSKPPGMRWDKKYIGINIILKSLGNPNLPELPLPISGGMFEPGRQLAIRYWNKIFNAIKAVERAASKRDFSSETFVRNVELLRELPKQPLYYD